MFSFVVATRNCVGDIPTLRATATRLADIAQFVVVDGGSTDGTREALGEISALTFVDHGPDRGISDAWNAGLSYATGTYIGFLGADDIPQRGFLEAAADHIRRRSDDGCYKIIFGDGLRCFRGMTRRSRPNPVPSLLFGPRPIFDVIHPGMLNHRSLFDERRFDYSYRLAGDLHFYLRLRGQISIDEVLYLGIVQAWISQTGLSNSASAAQRFAAEYRHMEQSLNIELGYSRTRLALVSAIGRVPSAFDAAKWLSWRIRTTSPRALTPTGRREQA